MSSIAEIAPDVFRISTHVESAQLQFNQFLIRDDEPLLYHTGQAVLFPDVMGAVESLIDTATLRWVGFSHFEADECGALNRWLEVAPNAQPMTDLLCAATCINDFSTRPPRIVEDNDAIVTGRHTLRYLVTPYVPHDWASSLLFDATARVLFCSDLLLQHGDPPPLRYDVLTPAIADLERGQHGPFHDPIPCTRMTADIFARLAALEPETLAIMHGASFRGDGATVLNGFHDALRDRFAPTTIDTRH